MSRRRQQGSRSGRSNNSGGGRGQNIRTDRIGSTLREVIGEELRRIDDDSTAHVNVTEVDVDNELTLARVYLSSLDLSDEDIEGVRGYTGRIKKAIARSTRLRRVPNLEFLVDPGLVTGTRVHEMLIGMHDDDRAFQTEPDGSEEE